jgi:hypothetical protein
VAPTLPAVLSQNSHTLSTFFLFDFFKISGLWYGEEIITHYQGRAGYLQSFEYCKEMELEEITEVRISSKAKR